MSDVRPGTAVIDTPEALLTSTSLGKGDDERRPRNSIGERPGTGGALSIGLVSFAIDPADGHLYPTSESTAIQPRDNGTVRLHPSDDTGETAARFRVVNAARLFIL